MDLIDRYLKTQEVPDSRLSGYLSEYFRWQSEQRQAEFLPSADNDVYLRTYLTQLRTRGIETALLHKRIAVLKDFYAWAKTEGLVTKSPFDQFNFDRPLLSRDQIRRRVDVHHADAQERELLHMRAINQLTGELNRSVDVKTVLDRTLVALVDVMSLKSAWFFISTSSGLPGVGRMSQQLHDFAVPAAFGLPPGLERDNGYYLRCTPDCHCQSLLRSGNLVRAVNVVECTRLIDSLNDNGDNQGLLFHASVPIMIRDQMLGILNAATEEWQFLTAADLQFLTTVGAQVTAALERAQLYDELAAQRVRLEREINMARAVQASLIPQNLPEIPGFSISAVWHAAREMAGDFYDVFELPDGRWAVLIADVSDKGAPAALFMAMTRSLIRASASVHTSPAMTLKEVNLRVNAHSSSGMFVTVFYAILDAQASTLCYANAGQDPPLLRRASGELEKLMPTGALIGVFDELVITDGLLTLNPGDILVAYTDGITDALDPQGSAYGLKRLCTILMETSHCTAKPLLSCLMDDLTSFVQQAPAFDDITMLVIANEGSI